MNPPLSVNVKWFILFSKQDTAQSYKLHLWWTPPDIVASRTQKSRFLTTYLGRSDSQRSSTRLVLVISARCRHKTQLFNTICSHLSRSIWHFFFLSTTWCHSFGWDVSTRAVADSSCEHQWIGYSSVCKQKRLHNDIKSIQFSSSTAIVHTIYHQKCYFIHSSWN